MSIDITLNEREMHWAEQIAHERHNEAVQSGRPDRHGFDGRNGYNIHRLGAAGELAFAKALGVPWDATVNTFKAPDQGDCIQVRTRSKHHYELLIRDNDNDDEVFIHITGEPPSFIIHGWLTGKDAKQKKWRQTHGNRPPAYFVPTSELNHLVGK